MGQTESFYQFRCLILKSFCRKRNGVKDGQGLLLYSPRAGFIDGHNRILSEARRPSAFTKRERKATSNQNPPSTDSSTMKKVGIMNIH